MKMKITIDDVYSYSPYIYNSYQISENQIHPAGYDITVNKYCIEKIRESEIKYPVLLKTPIIDYLPPMLEQRWFLGTFTIFELLKKGVKVTLVSGSDFVAKLWDYPKTEDYPEMSELQDNLNIIMPFWFFEDETYSALDPSMPKFGLRLVMFEYILGKGVKVEPYFNPLPEFADETSRAKDIFYQTFPNLVPDEARQAELRYILDDSQIKMWEEMKKVNKYTKKPRDYY